jgi:hypothetical protein
LPSQAPKPTHSKEGPEREKERERRLREDTTDRNNNKRTTPNSPKANKITNKQQNPSTKSYRPEQHQHHTKIPSSKRGNKKKIQPTTHNSSQKN